MSHTSDQMRFILISWFEKSVSSYFITYNIYSTITLFVSLFTSMYGRTKGVMCSVFVLHVSLCVIHLSSVSSNVPRSTIFLHFFSSIFGIVVVAVFSPPFYIAIDGIYSSLSIIPLLLLSCARTKVGIPKVLPYAPVQCTMYNVQCTYCTTQWDYGLSE